MGKWHKYLDLSDIILPIYHAFYVFIYKGINVQEEIPLDSEIVFILKSILVIHMSLLIVVTDVYKQKPYAAPFNIYMQFIQNLSW